MLRDALAAAAGLSLLCSWPAGPAVSATVIQRQLPAAAGQAGSLARSYKVVVPDGLQAGTPVPVVMVLHGGLLPRGDQAGTGPTIRMTDKAGVGNAGRA